MRRQVQKNTVRFRLKPVASAVMLSLAVQAAYAGPGMGVTTYADGRMTPTFYAHSPSGMRPDPTLLAKNNGVWDKVANPGFDTGKALRKFIDPLPGLCSVGPYPTVGRDAGGYVTNKCIPVAIADKATYPGSDYYEIGVVEYSEIMHSDLPKATKLRGYVQLNDPANPVTRDSTGKITAWPKPHYLGPVISATKGRAVRVKLVNLLPAGQALTSVDPLTGQVTYLGNAANGGRKGDLFLPVDQTLMGAGLGPDGATMYLQNRAELHLHGGDNPWISDGTPHQWILPAADELALKAAGKNAFARGASTHDVPDMKLDNSVPGEVTYFWPNNQSARMMFYHDHTAGITRLNVYAGEAAGYIIHDDVEKDLVARNVIPAAAQTIPLVIQEKTFVPADIALQDSKWNQDAWGKPGDLWFPHVYETNQDPLSDDGTNPVGRWDWGPWFWPVFPSLYNLPTGVYGDVTTTPEAFLDTPIVNGQAYPFLTVEPRAYRFQILNATNDRFLNLGLYVADPLQCSGDTPGSVGNRCNTEVTMVPFNTNGVLDPATGVITPFPNDTAVNPGIMGTGWGQPDGRAGGVPHPATVGPNIIQIGTEGGFLPSPVDIPSTPVNYEYNRRSITVLNIQEHGLLMGAAMRSDVIIDFSKYAGKTLIVYNDAPAPVPAFDPRIDFHVDAGATTDDYLSGGAMPSQVGFGPNTRTVMQIRVGSTGAAAPFDLPKLQSELPKAYAASQEKPIVPQMAYNAAWPGIATSDQYAKIATGTLQQPTFDFAAAAMPGVIGGVELQKNAAGVAVSGSGYVTTPTVTVTDNGFPRGAGALASATLKINHIGITDPGTGYVTAPLVTIGTLPDPITNVVAPGSGATAVAFLKVVGAAPNATQGTNNGRGTGYVAATTTVTIGAPDGWAKYGVDRPDLGLVRATATPVISGGAITGLTIVNPGAGYTVLPTVTIAGAGTGASYKLDAGVERVDLQTPTPGRPDLAGGLGYTDMTLVSVNLRGGGVGGTPGAAISATKSVPGTAATVDATISGTVTGAVAEVTLSNGGTGYHFKTAAGGSDPTVAISAPPRGVRALAQTTAAGLAKMAIHNKAIQELFEPNYGRMNATLGIEMPFTSALIQTTIPLAYIDPATETLKDGETQIWKITHNGVDTHPVHFHLVNLQLINRIGWDGTIKPPHANELGWRETIMMNPLEDIVVAVHAKKPTINGVTGKNGFGMPLSNRLMDPTQPQYAMTGFTQVDVNTGLPAVVYNDYENYNWEYVWHCHILGHEENDFMRPMVFNANEAKPTAATILAPTSGSYASVSSLNWRDNANTEYKYEVWVEKETTTIVRGRAVKSFGALELVGSALANASSFPLPKGVAPLTNFDPTTSRVRFTVRAVGGSSSTDSTVTFSYP